MPWFDRFIVTFFVISFGLALCSGFWCAFLLYQTSFRYGTIMLVVTLLVFFWYIDWSYRTLKRVW